MRRTFITAAVSLVAIGGWLVGAATSGSAVANHDYERVTDINARGFSYQSCATPPCPIPLVIGVPFEFRGLGANYDAVETLSFTYHTTAGLRLSVAPHLVNSDGSPVQMLDAERYLSPSAKMRSATLSWVLPSLKGGDRYTVFLSVDVVGTPPPTYEYSFSAITTVIEGAPA